MTTTCDETDIDWRIDLIAERGKQWGFAGPDLDNAVQEISLCVISFRFDAERSNGASLRTALIAVIDRQLQAIRRREARYAKCLQRLRRSQRMTSGPEDQPQEPSYRDSIPLVLDVRTVLSRLCADDRRLCKALSDGCSVQEIAERMGCDWHTIDRRVARIREHFTQVGLDGWLEAA